MILFYAIGIAIYIYRGKQCETKNERTILYGCAGVFFAFLFWRIFYLWNELIIQGVYINNIYYGDYRNLTPIQDILVKLALISFVFGFFIFIFALELIIRRTRFILSIIQSFFMILILILPFDLIYSFIYHIILVYVIINSIILLFYITYLSQYEFKSTTSFIILGGSLMTIGFYLCSPIVKINYSVPLFLMPVIFILGCFIALFPLIVNPIKIANAVKIWKIMGFLTILDQILIIIFHILSKLFLFIIVSLIDLIAYIIMYHYTMKNIEKEHTKHYAIKDNGPFSNILKAFSKKNIEEIYRLIIENANDLIIIFNDNFEIEMINEKSCQKLLGYSKNDLIIEKIQHFIHAEDIEKIEKLQKNILLNGEDSAEIRIRKKDNNYLWFEIKGALFKDFNQNFKLLTISRDITDKNKVQELIKAEMIRLRKMDEIRKEFMAHASHEIKNPLSSLVLNLEMLQHKYLQKNFTNFENTIKDMKEQSISVKNLAVNLLEYTLLEIHKSNLKKKQVDISKVLINCIKAEKLRAEVRGIKMNHDFSDKLYLECDESALTQVFQNLISNAINYTPKCKDSDINIRAIKMDNKIIVSIKDYGIGLTQDHIKELFIWGSQIDTESKDIIKGSGIGLYISKQIVEIHGGMISAESQGINKGCTFFVELPIN